ncbi:hypothetical protein H0X06_04420, partial [Candidatus Dependentiae bacterium]|nr:hypothetical protein [Candidatus Dependentiae bacterium]
MNYGINFLVIALMMTTVSHCMENPEKLISVTERNAQKTQKNELSISYEGNNLFFQKTFVDERSQKIIVKDKVKISTSHKYMHNLLQFIRCSRNVLPLELRFLIATTLTRLALGKSIENYRNPFNGFKCLTKDFSSLVFSPDGETFLMGLS